MKPGDVVVHARSARRMTVDSIDGAWVTCVWFVEGQLYRREILAAWLVGPKQALA